MSKAFLREAPPTQNEWPVIFDKALKFINLSRKATVFDLVR
jgi:hypothetical protein